MKSPIKRRLDMYGKVRSTGISHAEGHPISLGREQQCSTFLTPPLRPHPSTWVCYPPSALASHPTLIQPLFQAHPQANHRSHLSFAIDSPHQMPTLLLSSFCLSPSHTLWIPGPPHRQRRSLCYTALCLLSQVGIKVLENKGHKVFEDLLL